MEINIFIITLRDIVEFEKRLFMEPTVDHLKLRKESTDAVPIFLKLISLEIIF